jgi:signal transduction histidine kinase
MLHDFLSANRSELIVRCRTKVGQRTVPRATDEELEFGIPLFLDQLMETLRIEQTGHPMRSREVSGASGGGGHSSHSKMGRSAALHGGELLQHGFSIDQVVHDYGDLCQAITDLAFERKAPIEVDEFRTLNRSLDNAIGSAVAEYLSQHDVAVAGQNAVALNERLGFFAHEVRNLLNTATLALTAIKAGNVGLGGATGAVLDRSLVGLRTLVDRSLAEVRITAGMPVQRRVFSLAQFIGEVKVAALLEAKVRDCVFTVGAVDPTLAVEADRDLLFSALGNLLQNAFKFTRPHSEVALNAYASGDRVRIDVEDACGGLPPGSADKMFVPFTQGSADKSGLGLGLSISRRSVEAIGGRLSVRDIPGSGCMFTIDLPRHAAPAAPIARH